MQVGQPLFVAQPATVKIRISRDFFNAIRAFQRENVGHENHVPDLGYFSACKVR